MAKLGVREYVGIEYRLPDESALPAASALPVDYEACGLCGFDHSYEYEEAADWHGRDLTWRRATGRLPVYA